jgi:hypothetical protein
MTDKVTNRARILNAAVIIAVVSLVALVVYGNRFQKQKQQQQNAPDRGFSVPTGALTAAGGTATDRQQTETTHPEPENPIAPMQPLSTESSAGQITHPREASLILKRQSQQLRHEAAAEGILPKDKRSLALTEAEIQKLEADGDAIF